MFVLKSRYTKSLDKFNKITKEVQEIKNDNVNSNFRELLSIVNPKGTFILKKESYEWFKERYKENLNKWYFKKLEDIKRDDNKIWFYVEDGMPYNCFKLKLLLIDEEDFKNHFEVFVTYTGNIKVEHYK